MLDGADVILPTADEKTQLLKQHNGAFNSVRQGTVGASIFNLLNSAIGAGILSLPLAFYYSGLVLGSILVFLLAVISAYCLLILAQTAELYPTANSYEKLVTYIYGKKTGYVITACIILNCIGTCTGFLIIVGDLLSQICQLIFPNATILHSTLFIIFVVSFVSILPLTSLKHFNSMRFSSAVAVSSILFVIAVIISRSSQRMREDDYSFSDVKLFNASTTIFSALPLICFALSCHLQLVPIHSEMKDYMNLKSVKIMSVGAETICFVLYTITGIFGYLLFPTTVTDNILNDFPDDDVLVTVARAVLSFIIVCHYPSTGFVLRRVVDNIVFKGTDDTLIRRAGMSLACWGLCFLIAWRVPHISLVFGIMGSTVTSLLTFFFPAMFLYKHKDHPDWRGVRGSTAVTITILIGILSAIMFFVGTATTIVNFVEGKSSGGH